MKDEFNGSVLSDDTFLLTLYHPDPMYYPDPTLRANQASDIVAVSILSSLFLCLSELLFSPPLHRFPILPPVLFVRFLCFSHLSSLPPLFPPTSISILSPSPQLLPRESPRVFPDECPLYHPSFPLIWANILLTFLLDLGIPPVRASWVLRFCKLRQMCTGGIDQD